MFYRSLFYCKVLFVGSERMVLYMEKLLSEERVEEILRLGVCNCLPWTIINACYDYVSSHNLINDAENQLNDYIQSRLNEGLEVPHIENVQLEYLVSQFASRKDCNVADNDLWREIIGDALK